MDFNEIFRLTEAKKPYLSGEDVISGIQRGEILRKELPMWIQQAIKPNKRQKDENGEFSETEEDFTARMESSKEDLDFIKSKCDEFIADAKEFFKDKPSVTPNEALAFLLKKAEDKETLVKILDESKDALFQIASTGNSQNIKNIPEYKELESKPYSLEVWHNFEKAAQDFSFETKRKRGKLGDGDYVTLYEDSRWGLFTPTSFDGDVKLASGLVEFTGKNRYNNTSLMSKTQWCTAADETFYKRYSAEGNKYYVIHLYNNEGRCEEAWQAAFNYRNHCEFMDKYDERKFTFILENAPEDLLSKIVCDNPKSKALGINLLEAKGYMDFFKGSIKYGREVESYEELLDMILVAGRENLEKFESDYANNVFEPNVKREFLSITDDYDDKPYEYIKDCLVRYSNGIKNKTIVPEVDMRSFLRIPDACEAYSRHVFNNEISPELVPFNTFNRTESENLPIMVDYCKKRKDNELVDSIDYYDYESNPAKALSFSKYTNEGRLDTRFISFTNYIDHPKASLDLSYYTVGKDLSRLIMYETLRIGETPTEDILKKEANTKKSSLIIDYIKKPIVRDYIRSFCEGKINEDVTFKFWKDVYKTENYMNSTLKYCALCKAGYIDRELVSLHNFVRDNGGEVTGIKEYQDAVAEGLVDPKKCDFKNASTPETLQIAKDYCEDISNGSLLPETSFTDFLYHTKYKDIGKDKGTQYMYEYAKLVKSGQLDSNEVEMDTFKWTGDTEGGKQALIDFCKAKKLGLILPDIKLDTYVSHADDYSDFTQKYIEYSSLVKNGELNRGKVSVRDYASYPEESKLFTQALKDGTTKCTDFWNFRSEVKYKMYDILVEKGEIDGELISKWSYEHYPDDAVEYTAKVRNGEIDSILVPFNVGYGYGRGNNKGYVNNSEEAIEYCQKVRNKTINPKEIGFGYYVDNNKIIEEFNRLVKDGTIDPKIITLKTFCESEINREAAVGYGQAVKSGAIDRKITNFRTFCNNLKYEWDDSSNKRYIDMDKTLRYHTNFCDAVKATGIDPKLASHARAYAGDKNFLISFFNEVKAGNVEPLHVYDYYTKYISNKEMNESTFKLVYRNRF